MNYFPDKPWNVGDEFENETTGVVYRYDGTKWVATQDSDPLIEYLPLSGGDLSGKLNINVNSGEALTINTDKIKFWSSGAVALKGYTNFKDDELVTKKYVDDTIPEIPEIPTSFRKLRFARDKDWNNLRPGEFGLMDKDNGFVGKWSEAYSIFFNGVDVDGNRLVKDDNVQDYVSELGSALSVFTSSGDRPILRVTPTLSKLGGLVQLEYVKDLDLFWLGWLESNCSALQTSTNDNLSNGQTFLFNIPDLFL